MEVLDWDWMALAALERPMNSGRMRNDYYWMRMSNG